MRRAPLLPCPSRAVGLRLVGGATAVGYTVVPTITLVAGAGPA